MSEISALELTKIVKFYIVIAVLVCIFGFIEYALPIEFWISMGYFDFKNIASVGIPSTGLDERDYNIFFFAHFGGHETRRMISTLGSPLHVAFFILLPIFIVYSCLVFKTRLFKKINGLNVDKFIFLILLCGLLLTVVRGPIIAFVTTVLVAIAIYIKGAKKVYFYCVGGIILLLLFFVFNKSIVQIIMTTITLEDSSALGHYMAHEYALEVLPQHPLGFGLGQSGSVGKTYGSGEGVGESLFLTIAGELGFGGLLVFIVIITSSLIFLHNRFKQLIFKDNEFLKVMTFALICSTIAYFVSSFNTEQWRGFTMSGLYWFLLGQIIRSYIMIDKGRNNGIYN